MFKKIRPLSRTTDKNLHFDPSQSYQFAANETLVPISAGEAEFVAREYVIVFSTRNGELPSALVGVRQGVNSYVQPSGHWVARYIPAHVRRYPFILGAKTQTTGIKPEKNEYTLMIDETAPHLSKKTGQLLVSEDGKPTEVLQKVEQVLTNLQHNIELTRVLTGEIEKTGLLVEKPLHVKLKSGPIAELKGLRVVDRNKLAEFGEKQLYKVMQTGALAFIFAHLVSLSNLQDSMLVQDVGKDKEDIPDIEAFFRDKDKLFRFDA
jgi:hypothetical protein